MMKQFPVFYRGEIYQVQVDDDDAVRIEEILNKKAERGPWMNRKKSLSYVPAWKDRGFRPAIWTQGKLWYLSRWILGVTDSKHIVDHIDQDPLNNQRANLRIVGKRENSYNSGKRGWERKNKSSKYRGVIWSKQTNRWQAVVHLTNGKSKCSFHKDEEDAARARDKMLMQLLGVNDCLNFPLDENKKEKGEHD